MKRALMVGCLATMLMASIGLAQPTTQPETAPAPAGRGAPLFPGAGRGAARGPITRIQRQEAYNWVRENMPALAKLIDESAAPSVRRNRLITFAFNRMQSEQSAANDPALQEKIRKNIQGEDAAFQLLYELTRADPSERGAIEEKLRAKTREIVDDSLQERRTRLENLRARLAEEERRLSDDEANRERMVQNRFRTMLDIPKLPGSGSPTGGDDVNANETGPQQ
jgi:hypothetical protein